MSFVEHIAVRVAGMLVDGWMDGWMSADSKCIHFHSLTSEWIKDDAPVCEERGKYSLIGISVGWQEVTGRQIIHTHTHSYT